MPNSANRSNGGGSNSNQGQPKHRTSRSSSEKSNPERSDLKRGDNPKQRGENTGRTSNQGRKSASGGE